jgi:hypothetical protein
MNPLWWSSAKRHPLQRNCVVGAARSIPARRFASLVYVDRQGALI